MKCRQVNALCNHLMQWLVLLIISTTGSFLLNTFASDEGKTWVYKQSTSRLMLDGASVGEEHTGNGDGLNNPKTGDKMNFGPITRGKWKIGDVCKHDTKGSIVMKLAPVEHDVRGRDGFLIQWDNAKGNKSASGRCIILSKELRMKISESKVRVLKVI